MSNLSHRKKRKLAGKARAAVNSLAAFADELDGPDYDPAEVAFTPQAKEMIDALVAADAPQTYTAEEAWGKMEEGYECWSMDRGCYSRGYLNGDGRVAWTEGDDTYAIHHFVAGNKHQYRTGKIHPEAHKHALQRHIAAGMVVGSRVEVVGGWKMGDGGFDIPAAMAPINCTGSVTGFDDRGVRCRVGNIHSIYPAHCLRLIEAEPEAASPPPKPEDQVPPATKTAEGGGDAATVLKKWVGWVASGQLDFTAEHIHEAQQALVAAGLDPLHYDPADVAFTPKPPPTSTPGSVWWAIDKMRGGAVCECEGLHHRFHDGLLQWVNFDGWVPACLTTGDLASTEWRVVEGGGE